MTKRQIRAEYPLFEREEAPTITGKNAESRTIDVIWTTGAEVPRRDFWTGDKFVEVLEVSDRAVDLSALNNGAAVLDSHYGLASEQPAVVERAWIENGKGMATLRFARAGVDPKADMLFEKVSGAIVRKISCGYQTLEQSRDWSKDPPVFTATRWKPKEISFVSVAADDGAGVRGTKGGAQDAPLYACEIIDRGDPANGKEIVMSKKNDPSGGTALETKIVSEEIREQPANDEAVRAARDSGIAGERTRIAAIHERGTALDMPQDVIQRAIADGINPDQASTRFIDERAARSPQRPALGGAHTPRGGLDEVETRRVGVEEALLNRAFPATVALTDKGREWRGLRLMELGRELLTAQGVKTRGFGPLELAARALQTTSELPAILANVANKSLQMGYAAEPRTFLPFCVQHDAADFKTITSALLSEGSDLTQVNEQGEFQRGTVTDSKETWNLVTYGKIFGFTRQVMINDDLQALTRLPYQFGQSGIRKENDIVWAIFTVNANMADGVALFHATHSNLSTSSALALAGLGTVRTAMRKQKGPDGNQTLNLMLKYVIVPAALETALEQLMSPALFAVTSATVVPAFYRSLVPIVEARLDVASSTTWYGACDPSQNSTIEYGYLQGNQGVYLETRDGYNIDGIEMKVRHDFGAKAVNHRGLAKATA